MSMQRVPRVWFRLEPSSMRGVRRELSRMLERHLSARFGPVRSFGLPLVPVSQLMLSADGKEFLVALAQEKRGGEGDRPWLLTINPFDYPVPKRNLPKGEEKKYTKGLMAISDEIAVLLSNTPAVTRQRWFFEDWGGKPGVGTPTELPWHADVPD
jgi:hypothetical protein